MKVQEFLTRDNFTMDCQARDLYAKQVGLFDKRAVRFDLEGAMERCYGYNMYEWWKPRILYHLQQTYGNWIKSIGQFNDFFGFEEVMVVVRKFDL